MKSGNTFCKWMPTALTLIFAAQVCTTSAHAFTVSAFDQLEVDSGARTRVLVIGFSDGNSRNFIHAAIAKALRYREAFPADQVVLIGAHESMGDPGLSDVKQPRLNHLAHIERTLDGPELLLQLSALEKIASIDYFGHSRILRGLGLENPQEKVVHVLALQTPGVAELASHFTADAYATLNGCNTGFVLAPEFSRLWGIPVMGGLTASDFQTLRKDGNWYFHNRGQFPKGLSQSVWNTSSYKIARYCKNGACTRLVTENKPYQSEKWGEFDSGLGFSKFFCNFEDKDARCERTIAKAAMGFVSVRPLKAGSMSYPDFKAVVRDILCPSSTDRQARASCHKALEAAEQSDNRVFTSFRGNPLECDKSGCKFELTNVETEKVGLSAPRNRSPRTQINEYLMYLRGYELLLGT